MDVSLAEVLLAYKQAKQALFQELRTPDRLDIARAEAEIQVRLSKVKESAQHDHWFDGMPLGRLWLPVKSATFAKPASSQISVIDGPPVRRLRGLALRLHLTPSTEFATVETLWLWKFGAALETVISNSVRGNRLMLRGPEHRFDLNGREPFRFWPEAYRRFRDDGVEVARSLLSKRHGECSIVTFDLSSYYDEIDPSFLTSAEFVKEVIDGSAAAGIAFDPSDYLPATSSLLRAFGRYRSRRAVLLGVSSRRGIPIGALTSRVIANVALAKLDSHVKSLASVRYYARYVDDILIVSTDRLDDKKTASLRSIASRFLPVVPGSGQAIALDSQVLGRKKSSFVLQTTKLKAYQLRGRRGLDFLAAIERDVRLITSERRDLINRDGLDSESTLAGLVVGADDRIPVQVLRDVDRLRVERFAANVSVSKVDDATKFLEGGDAAALCQKKLRPLAEAVTDPDHWLEFFDTASRALGVAVRAGDRFTSAAILQRLKERLAPLRGPMPSALTWNGHKVSGLKVKTALLSWFDTRILQEVCGSISPHALSSKAKTREELHQICGSPATAAAFGLTATRVFMGGAYLQAADLRSIDVESDYRSSKRQPRRHPPSGVSLISAGLEESLVTRGRMKRIRQFIRACRLLGDPVYRDAQALDIVMMTRPPSTFDVSYRWARARRSSAELIAVINAVRGTQYRKSVVARLGPDTTRVGRAHRAGSRRELRVMLGNLSASDDWAWQAATGQPVLGPARLTSLLRVVNEAVRESRRGAKPALLVLPELSVPRAWFRLIAEHVIGANVGLVAGVEYLNRGQSVANEAIGVFSPGYGMGVAFVWQKGRPAREEERKLLGRQVSFSRPQFGRPLAVHTHGVTMSALVCSELLEVERRNQLVGRIDLLLVPSWNPDTATFDHTIQTTANDVHCYIAVANCGHYSDCRIYGPSDIRWKREVCRLISRDRDEVISADVDFGPLRQFQLDSGDPSSDPVGFKPVPPGFVFRRPRR